MKLGSLLKVVLLLLTGAVITGLVFGPEVLERRMNLVVAHQPYAISDQTRDLHQSLIIGDWHADSTLWQRNLSESYDYGHVDIPRLQAGNVALQMFTAVTKSPSGLNLHENDAGNYDDITRLALLQRWPVKTWSSLTERALYQSDKLHKLAKHDSDNFHLITSQAELASFIEERKKSPKLVGGLLGTEGSHALDGELENIQVLFDNGFRMMSLQHFFDNKLGGSLHGVRQSGLTEFGRQAIKKMQSLDIIVDVSHSSEQVVEDVLAISEKPLVVSHTGFKGHCDSERNISDKLMQAIARQGGLIGVGYWQEAVCGTDPKDIAAAISYAIDLLGVEHISLGSDFDGTVATGMDTSELSALTQALLDANLTEQQIRLVMGDNMLRFLQQNLPRAALN